MVQSPTRCATCKWDVHRGCCLLTYLHSPSCNPIPQRSSFIHHTTLNLAASQQDTRISHPPVRVPHGSESDSWYCLRTTLPSWMLSPNLTTHFFLPTDREKVQQVAESKDISHICWGTTWFRARPLMLKPGRYPLWTLFSKLSTHFIL